MLKKIAIGTGVIFLAVCIFIGFTFFGNPVSKMLVMKNAREYIQKNWPEDNYVIDSVEYDFKTSVYYAFVKHPGSIDNHFTLYCSGSGKVSYDTYESAVEEKWNTAGRINDEYREAVDKAFMKESFTYNHDIAFGDIEFADSVSVADEAVADYAVYTSSLVLDGEYDIYEMGKKAGCITLYVNDSEVSAEKLAEVLLSVKKLMDEEVVGFYAIDCVLEYPRNEDGASQKTGRVEVMNFLYDDIYEEGLVERVENSDKKAKAYYKKLDEVKSEDLHIEA